MEVKTETDAPKPDLRQATYELLRSVRNPSVEEIKALKERGLVTIPGLEAKTLVQVVRENPGYFTDGSFVYAGSRPRPGLKDYVPPAVSIALKPAQLALPGSFLKPLVDQLAMCEEYSQSLAGEFPDARAIMLPATMYAQADMVYRQISSEEPLFRYFYARALDQTSDSMVAILGRVHPISNLNVSTSYAQEGNPHVGAVPAVVFTKK